MNKQDIEKFINELKADEKLLDEDEKVCSISRFHYLNGKRCGIMSVRLQLEHLLLQK